MPALLPTQITTTFEQADHQIWSRADVLSLIDASLDAWTTSEETPGAIQFEGNAKTDVLKAIIEKTRLDRVQFDFPYRKVTRYFWGEVSAFAAIQSVDDSGYFSHFTAMHLHGLTEQIPKAIYFNVEQPATGGGGELSQAGIDRAFKGKCRVSRNVIKYGGYTIHKLNGQNTRQLGVTDLLSDRGPDLRVTDIERTLIDATVRPVYSGGVGEVAQAYRSAADRVSVATIVSYLRKLNYTYPYHQAIGFYLERAGNCSKSDLAALETFPIEFDFYLDYQLKNPGYNERWHLFIPKGF